jgi:glycosyltransferase involved in cell wall biosynthesis
MAVLTRGEDVTVVLPAHNEAASIATVLAGCREHLPSAELLVVDDGSKDDTAAIAERSGARVERFASNRGKGAAVRHGIASASGSVIVLLDADGQDDPADLPCLLAALSPDVDMVIGSRFLGHFEDRAITKINRVGNEFLTGVVNLLFRANVTDAQAGVRAIRRAALQRIDIAADGYDIEADVLLKLLRAGSRVTEIGVRRSARLHGQSDLSSVRDGLRILRRILRVRFGT